MLNLSTALPKHFLQQSYFMWSNIVGQFIVVLCMVIPFGLINIDSVEYGIIIKLFPALMCLLWSLVWYLDKNRLSYICGRYLWPICYSMGPARDFGRNLGSGV